jgi:SAM-dependent methyltransferase
MFIDSNTKRRKRLDKLPKAKPAAWVGSERGQCGNFDHLNFRLSSSNGLVADTNQLYLRHDAVNLDSTILKQLACPRCRSRLNDLSCSACQIAYPAVDGVPVLINDANSLFKISDVLQDRETTYRKSSPLKRFIKSILPSISTNVKAKANLKSFFERLLTENPNPNVLVVGGAVTGAGLESIPSQVTLVEIDAALGPRTAVVCDAHDLPFLDGTFDGVIAQAVLEHVLGPEACVREMYRVLRGGGMVYAETPFMQQVHAGRYDFTRFSHLGHRYLFRHFSELRSGPCSGPGTAMAWAYAYLLQSFFRNQTFGQAAFAFGSLTGFWLKYLDHLVIDLPGSYDAASAYYFLGTKGESNLSGQELIAGYQGNIY